MFSEAGLFPSFILFESNKMHRKICLNSAFQKRNCGTSKVTNEERAKRMADHGFFEVDIMGFHHRRKQEKERVAPFQYLLQTAVHRHSFREEMNAFIPRDLVRLNQSQTSKLVH